MSLKASIGRRIFAKSLPAVPLAAAQVHGHLGMLNTATEGKRAMPSCGQSIAVDPVEEAAHIAKRKKLDAARMFLYNEGGMQPLRARERLDAFTILNPNIIALRSVSDQHKIHMHLKHEAMMHRERESFKERVLRMFGLEEDKSAYYNLF